MEEGGASRPRRSCLIVPGHDERKLARAAQSGADQVVIDLEDAVSPEHKELARQVADAAIRDAAWSTMAVSVRINPLGTPWHEGDIAFVSQVSVASVVVPKVESERDLALLDRPVEALIETAAGVVACDQIAALPHVEALILGPGDLAASLGTRAPTIGIGPHLDYALPRVLVAARAAGRAAVDGPFAAFTDEAGFRDSAERARSLGYDGKWCIHPAQVAICNEVFTPTAAEIEWARRVVDAVGARAEHGEMVDVASRRMAIRLLAQASARPAG